MCWTHIRRMFSGRWSPPRPNGWRWWYSRRCRSLAPPSRRVDVAASASVALVHRPANGRGDAPGGGRRVGRREVLAGPAVAAKRRASSRSSFSVTAASMIAPRSPSGTCERMRARSRWSFSWSPAVAVNCTLYRPGARGWTTGGEGRGQWTRRAWERGSARREGEGMCQARRYRSTHSGRSWLNCRKHWILVARTTSAAAPRKERARESRAVVSPGVAASGTVRLSEAPLRRSAPRSFAWTDALRAGAESPDSLP